MIHDIESSNDHAPQCLHGGAGNQKTVFPTPLTSSASFNPTLLNDIGRAIALETRAYGICQCFAPVIGLAREPRWGRVEETYGRIVCYITLLLGYCVCINKHV